MAQAAKKNAKAKTNTKIAEKSQAKEVWKNIGLVVLPLAVGILSVLLTGNQMDSFASFNKPPLSPPSWLFPVVWTILYILMGVASIFFFQKIKKKSEEKVTVALRWLYGLQLLLNFTWTLVFFGFDSFYAAFGILVALWGTILTLLILSFKHFRASFWCLLPYLIWVTFAGYLNIMIAVLN